MIKLILVVFFILYLSGCATSQYSCGQYPEAGCQPVSTVYNRTNDGYHDYRKTLYSKNGKKNSKSRSRRRIDKVNTIQVSQAHRVLNYTSPGDPILSQPVVMRILFNSWLDKENDLNAGGFVFVKIRGGEWQMDK